MCSCISICDALLNLLSWNSGGAPFPASSRRHQLPPPLINSCTAIHPSLLSIVPLLEEHPHHIPTCSDFSSPITEKQKNPTSASSYWPLFPLQQHSSETTFAVSFASALILYRKSSCNSKPKWLLTSPIIYSRNILSLVFILCDAAVSETAPHSCFFSTWPVGHPLPWSFCLLFPLLAPHQAHF